VIAIVSLEGFVYGLMEKPVGERKKLAVNISVILDAAFIWGDLLPAGYFHSVVKYKMKRFSICTRGMNFPVWKDVPKFQDYLI
jgi:hypothetical protein